jgi:hypothetical protein
MKRVKYLEQYKDRMGEEESPFIFRSVPPPAETPQKMAKKAKKAKVARNARKPAKFALKKKDKKSAKPAEAIKPDHFPFSLFNQFNICPRDFFPIDITNALLFIQSSLAHQKLFISHYATCLRKKECVNTFPFILHSPDHFKQLKAAIFKLRTLRRQFKILLHHWMSKKLLKTVNQEDPVTFEVPANPVGIINWSTRKRYVFEGSTLMRDITQRLLCHDSYFQDPQCPRNPLTNLPLTQAQVLSVWNQLRTANASSAFANFRQARFDMSRFCEEFSAPLQLHALRSAFKDLTDVDVQERILDFIHYCYDQESIDCYSNVYLHCLRHYPHNPVMKKWITICLRYYEVYIVHAANPEKLKAIHDRLFREADELLESQTILRNLVACERRLTTRSVAQAQLPVVNPVTTITFEVAALQITNLLNSL